MFFKSTRNAFCSFSFLDNIITDMSNPRTVFWFRYCLRLSCVVFPCVLDHSLATGFPDHVDTTICICFSMHSRITDVLIMALAETITASTFSAGTSVFSSFVLITKES